MTFKKWIVSLIVLLLVGVVGVVGIGHIQKKLEEPTGMYVEHNGKVYEANDAGIAVEFSKTAKLSVKHADDWGMYDVRGCKVKVYANTTDDCNFSYTVGDDTTPLYFSLLKDVTAAFVQEPSAYDGKGFDLDENGTFEMTFDKFFTFDKLLSRLYDGQAVTLEKEIDAAAYPYFLLEVRSPDNKEVITLPITLRELFGTVTEIELDKTQVAF